MAHNWWARGVMDNASDYGSEDSRFDSWLARSAVFYVSVTPQQTVGKMALQPVFVIIVVLPFVF